MITVKIHGNNDQIDIEGHAMYDDLGKDIVCAGVSSIVTTSINAILSFNENYLSYRQDKSAYDKFIIEIKEHNEIVDKLINNMIEMLKDVEEDYPKNIKIRKEN